MAFLFQKFQEAVKVLAKSPTFAKEGRHLQFEADINKLFLFTSHNRLGKKADADEIIEIIEMASKASLVEQQKQVQENLHVQKLPLGIVVLVLLLAGLLLWIIITAQLWQKRS